LISYKIQFLNEVINKNSFDVFFEILLGVLAAFERIAGCTILNCFIVPLLKKIQ